jgi:hypothetical protein
VPSVLSLWRDLSRGARVGVSSAAVLVLLAVPLGAIGPVVRAQVSARAAARGFTVDVERVRPSWGGVWLLGVGFRGPNGRVTGRVDAVRVPFGDAPVEIHGGAIALRGPPAEIQREISPEHAASPAPRGRRLVRADGLGVHWSELDRRGSGLQAWGVAVERTADSDRVHVDLARAETRGGALEASGVALSLAAAGTGRVRQVHVDRAEAALDLDALTRRAERATNGTPSGTTKVPSDETATAGSSPAARAGYALGFATVAEVAKQALPEGAGVRVDSALLALRFHGEHLGFGPSEVDVHREADALALEVSPSERPSAGATALSLRGKLPFGADAPSVELEGGPVSLAALGVRDGELGLTHTREATLEAHLRVELGSDAVRGSGSGSLVNVSLHRPEISAREVRGLKLGFRANGQTALDGSRLSLRDTELTIGDVKLAGNFELERDAAGSRVRLGGGVPLASCDAVVKSLPPALLNDAAGVKLEGTFALDHALTYDSAHPDALALTLHVENGCRVVDAPAELAPERFRSAWSREVKGPDGSPVTIRSGPGTPEWLYYDEIPHAMEVAVLVCEDGGFYRHHGFDFRAMESAMKDDIRAGRFVRGASTISMQLAKNLYLGKEKTLSRKIEEALLTMLLEAKLTKKELMELYLNVVELGPGIYGIGEAAKYYFDEDARELSLAQALYLASILPDPTRQHFEPDGSLNPRWTAYLRKLMHIARRVDRISDEELEAGLAEEIAFRKGNGESGPRDLDATEPASITTRHRPTLDEEAPDAP